MPGPITLRPGNWTPSEEGSLDIPLLHTTRRQLGSLTLERRPPDDLFTSSSEQARRFQIPSGPADGLEIYFLPAAHEAALSLAQHHHYPHPSDTHVLLFRQRDAWGLLFLPTVRITAAQMTVDGMLQAIHPNPTLPNTLTGLAHFLKMDPQGLLGLFKLPPPDHDNELSLDLRLKREHLQNLTLPRPLSKMTKTERAWIQQYFRVVQWLTVENPGPAETAMARAWILEGLRRASQGDLEIIEILRPPQNAIHFWELARMLGLSERADVVELFSKTLLFHEQRLQDTLAQLRDLNLNRNLDWATGKIAEATGDMNPLSSWREELLENLRSPSSPEEITEHWQNAVDALWENTELRNHFLTHEALFQSLQELRGVLRTNLREQGLAHVLEQLSQIPIARIFPHPQFEQSIITLLQTPLSPEASLWVIHTMRRLSQRTEKTPIQNLWPELMQEARDQRNVFENLATTEDNLVALEEWLQILQKLGAASDPPLPRRVQPPMAPGQGRVRLAVISGAVDSASPVEAEILINPELALFFERYSIPEALQREALSLMGSRSWTDPSISRPLAELFWKNNLDSAGDAMGERIRGGTTRETIREVK